MKPSFELLEKGCAETELQSLWEPNANWYKPTSLLLNALMRKEHFKLMSFSSPHPFPAPVEEKCLFFLYNFSLLDVAKCLVIVLHLTDLLLRSCQQPKDNQQLAQFSRHIKNKNKNKEWTMHISLEIMSHCSYLSGIQRSGKQFLILKNALCNRDFLLKGDGSLTFREQRRGRTTQRINRHS